MSVNETTVTNSIINIVQSCTDELLAVTVVGGTMASYFVGISIPTEPMLLVLSYYFVKKAMEAARGE